MDFDLIKLKVKVDIQKLRDYYNIVQRDFQHLRWQKSLSETDDGVGGHRVENMFGWAIHTNGLDLSQPNPPYNISVSKSDTYRYTDLYFGIIKDFEQMFPFAHNYGISVHPPRTFINTHTDSDDFIKIHVPINTVDNSYFTFNDVEYHMECDGSMYLVNTTRPHGTDNRGIGDRIHLIFKIPQDKYEYVQSLEGLIG